MSRLLVFALCVLAARPGTAQVPAGTISGVVRDQAGAAIVGVEVHAVSRATGQVRRTTTGERGEYNLPALLPGEYELTVEAPGFQRTVRTAAVVAGVTTASDFVLPVGDMTESVRVEAATRNSASMPRRSAVRLPEPRLRDCR